MKIHVMFAAIICVSIMPDGISKANGIKNTQAGAKLYKKHCAPCHGDDAKGQDPSQPAGGFDKNMKRIAPALNGTGHSWHHSPELIYKYIEKGSIDNTSPMPAFGSILKDDEIKAIIAYINSLWPKEIMESYKERFPEERQ